MKSALIALVLIAGPAMAQNGGHPNGDYGLYVGDHARWQAEQDARAVAREEIAKEQEKTEGPTTDQPIPTGQQYKCSITSEHITCCHGGTIAGLEKCMPDSKEAR
jgi:hypothetical protein